MPSHPATSAARGGGDPHLSVPLADLSLGVTLRAPIYEDRSGDGLTLLLATGTTLTESLISRLRRRGITRALVRSSHLNQLICRKTAKPAGEPAAEAIGRRDANSQQTFHSRWTSTPQSFLHKIATHGATSYDAASKEQFLTKYRASLKKVEQLFEGLAHGDLDYAAPLASVSSESLLRIADDLDLFVALGLTPAADMYPCKHSLQTAMLAMSIGTILGLKSDELIELGIGCLVHDAGMLKIEPAVVHAQRPLNKIEFLEITKHPIFTFDALREVKGMPNGSRLVAYQMHERLNGSGYPRRRTANQIHYLAKIAAVADVYLALVSPRPHRPGMLAYHAIEQILHGARKGLYDLDVVRALLHTVSLFPIGSHVELSDGRLAKVVRSNRDAYMSPVVELTQGIAFLQPRPVIDLQQENGLKIVRAVSNAMLLPGGIL